MQLVWMAVSAVAVVVAAIFLWRHEFNIAFVVAVIGAVAWFLNYRVQMKSIVSAVEQERAVDEHDDDQ